jgi:hypothetical protein
MPENDDKPKAEPPEETASAVTEEKPLPDPVELERLRARLIAQYHGRR